MKHPHSNGESQRPPPSSPEPSQPHFVRSDSSSAWRVLRGALAFFGAVATFAVALVAAVALHLGTPPARRMAMDATNAALADVVRGRITIDRLDALSLAGIGGVDATIRAPGGTAVAHVHGLDARVRWLALVASLVSRGPVDIEVPRLSVENTEIVVAGRHRAPTLLEALEPKHASAPPTTGRAAKGVSVALDAIAVSRMRIRGLSDVLPIADASVEGLHGALRISPAAGTRIEVARARFDGYELASSQAPVVADVHGVAQVPTDASIESVDASVAVAGSVGAVAFTGDATKVGRRVDATIEVPTTPLSALEPFFGRAWPRVDATARFEAHGTLPALESTVHVSLGAATVDGHGRAVVPIEGEVPRATLAITARGLALRWLYSTAPPFEADADARVDVRATDAGLTASLDGDVAADGIAGSVSGEYHQGALALDARIRVPHLSRVVGLGTLRRTGSLVVDARGDLSIPSRQLNAVVHARGDELSAGELRAAHAEVDGTIRGSVGAPAFTARARASDFGLPGMSLSDVAVRASVRVGDGVVARDVHVRASRAGERVSASFARVRWRAPALDVEGGRIEGLGAPIVGSAHVRPGRVALDVSARAIDLPAVSRFVRIAPSFESGRAALIAKLEASSRATRGYIAINARDAGAAGYAGHLDLAANGTFAGESVSGAIVASDPAIGTAWAASDGAKLKGGLLSPRAVERVTGRARVGASVDLGALAAVARGLFPLEQVTGKLATEGEIVRDDAASGPVIALAASTRGLGLTLPSRGRRFRVDGVDATVRGELDSRSGSAQLGIALHDRHGLLLTVTGTADVPIQSMRASATPSSLERTPLNAHIEIPARSIDALPAILGRLPLRGSIEAVADLDGSVLAPRLVARLRARDVGLLRGPPCDALSLDATVAYDGEALHANVHGTRAGAQAIDARVDAPASVRDMVERHSLPSRVHADLHVARFPLGALGPLIEARIGGDVSGALVVDRSSTAVTADARLDATALRIGPSTFDHVAAKLAVRDRDVAVETRIDQPGAYAELRARGALRWNGVAPTLDDSRPLDLWLAAHDFRVRPFAPLLRRAVNRFDGRVNSDAHLHVTPGFHDGSLTGSIAFDRGVVELPAIGAELHDVEATVRMRPWGTWRVESLEASGLTGKLRARGIVRMDGLRFMGLEAHAEVAEKQKLPLTIEGAFFGSVSGKVDATARMASAERLDVDVDVPHLEIDLPHSIPHDVQSLTPDPTIKVGVIARPGEMVILPLNPQQAAEMRAAAEPPSAPPTEVRIASHLRNVLVKRDSTLRLVVGGSPTVQLDSKTAIDGQIAVARGYISLRGRKFTIEKGTVTFDGRAPDDPTIVATATYEAPDGTRVFASFVGPLESGKITLRSEPALTQNEILSVLLFGSADGTYGERSPAASGAVTAANIAGGFLAQKLGDVLRGVSGVDVATKLETSEPQNPRPEIEVGLSDRASVTLIYNLGVPPPGQNPDTTLLQVDWRLHKGWSAATTVGDRGTSILDFTWKYRY